MTPWIVEAAQAALDQLVKYAHDVGRDNTDEFTFRSMFMEETKRLRQGCRMHTEWEKFDLLVIDGDARVLIEFKYYVRRKRVSIDGQRTGFKGGAGPKNEGEFWQCVDKLRSAGPSRAGERILILVYAHEEDEAKVASFHKSYGDLAPSEKMLHVHAIRAGAFEARLCWVPFEPAAVERAA